MTHTFVISLMLWLTVVTSAVLWHTLLILKRMDPATHHGIRVGFWLRGVGLFLLLLSVGDYLFGEPLTWPWLLLFAASLSITGSALLHYSTRRVCKCEECPIRAAGIQACVGKAGRKA